MALSLLDGTSSNIDLSFGATPVSLKGTLNYISADIGNELFEQTTFASGGWRARVRGLKQMVGRAAGYLNTGNTYSDPLALLSGSGAAAFVQTYFTGCTLTGSMQIRNIHIGMAAAGNSELSFDFESYGAVTSAWVTS